MPAVAALTLCGDAGAVLIALETGVKQGIRWFFCAGLSVGLVSTGLLAVLEREKDDDILVMRKVCTRSTFFADVDNTDLYPHPCSGFASFRALLSH